MENKQPEAIVSALLDPDPKAQEELRRKRDADARSLVISRFTAAFVLLGVALGIVAAYLVGERVSTGGLWGGIGGAAIGQAVGAWRARRCAAQRSIQAGPLHRSA